VTLPLDRPPAAEAGPELLVLQKWEIFVGWFLHHTGKWPKAARFTLTQRLAAQRCAAPLRIAGPVAC